MIDTEALAIGEYAVVDADYRLVQRFDTEAAGVDVEAVRRETGERGRLLARYRDNLRRKSHEY